jgi:electron transport complex protein RnfG
MTDQKNINQSTSSSFNMLKAMVGIGLICALLIALTYESTLPIITKNKAEAFEKAIFKVLPDITSKTAFYLDENGDFLRLQEGETADNVVYAGYDDDKKLVGLAIEGSGQKVRRPRDWAIRSRRTKTSWPISKPWMPLSMQMVAR